jgi:hypothetical protein
MRPKKDNDSSKVKRKNTNIMIDVKKEIIAKHENGIFVSDLGTQFGMAKSTISTILKNRQTIKKADVARGMTVITKQRSQTVEEVDKLLLIWVKDTMLAGNSIFEGIICEKARRLPRAGKKERIPFQTITFHFLTTFHLCRQLSSIQVR